MMSIISAKHTGHTRLLILDDVPVLKAEHRVSIDGKIYPLIPVHSLKQAVAIPCQQAEPSMIGKTIEFI